MKRKLLIVVGVALAAATVSTVVFYKLISGSLAGNGHPTAEQRVVTAARDLPRGTHLTANDLKVITWSGDKPAGAFEQPKDLTGRLVDRDLREGEPIFDTGVSAPGENDGAGAIPPGMRAVSIHLSEYAGVAKMLENGDKVDVLAADSERRPGNLNTRVHTVLQGVVVLDNGKLEDANARRGVGPIVTLLVAAKDAEILSLADQAGAIRFALRNPLDDTTEESKGADWQDVTGKRTSSSREREINPPRSISRSRPAQRPQPARSADSGSDLAAVMPDLHSRRPETRLPEARLPETKPPPAADSDSNGVLLAITFAGLGDEALQELTAGLAQRYSGAPVILSAFQPEWNVAQRVRALQQAERLEVFADPNVLAMPATEAHFERASDSNGSTTLNWEHGAKSSDCTGRVGVRVTFVPTVSAGKRLRIRVTSEVAVPGAEPAAAAGDCAAPLVSTREWSGEIELADGQSFWVRGLIDRPGAWDFLRRLFPQRPLEHDRNDELAILVTPTLVAGARGKPLSAALPR